MPNLQRFVQIEYEKVSEFRARSATKELEAYKEGVNVLIREVAELFGEFAKKHNYSLEIVSEMAECIRDTAIVEGICLANKDFTHIEDYILASKMAVFYFYKTMFAPDMEYEADKAIELVLSPNTNDEIDSKTELMRWFRMLSQYLANGTDNENEQLQKGSNKRKSNS